MDCEKGGSLSMQIQKRQELNNPFSEEEILNYFTQICFALKYCHDRNIMHRNLKSENVYMSSSGLCKLGGFSIDKIVESIKVRA